MGHVYQFRNLVNGHVYVGSSDRPIPYRKKEHYYEVRQGTHYNPYFQNAWNKYGEENFIWELLETTDSPEQTLLREVYWIEYYVNMYGDGHVYNIAPPIKSQYGKKRVFTEQHKENLSKSQRARFEDPALVERMREMGKKGANSPKRKGYRHSESTKTVLSEKATERFKDKSNCPMFGKQLTEEHKDIIRKRQSKIWAGFVSPDGVEYRNIFNLHAFCREHGLIAAPMQRVAYGEVYQHKGWKLIDSVPPEPKVYGSLVAPDGTVYENITDQTKFAKEHGLVLSSLNQLLNGKLTSCKGWRKLN